MTDVSPFDSFDGPAVEVVRCVDWGATALGPVADWPRSLVTTVQTLLASGHAMCISWGSARTFIYNDAYIPMLGMRHPAAMGASFEEAWPEIWDEIEPLVQATLAGKTSTFKNLPLVMTRNGAEEQTWWTFSYSPLRNDSGAIAGLLNVTLETTKGVLAERDRDAALSALKANEGRLTALVSASSDAVYTMSADWTEMRQLTGRGFIADTESPTIRWMDEYIFPPDRAAVAQAVDAAIAARSVFELEHRVRRADGGVGWIVSRAVPILRDDGEIQEWFGMAADVTAHRASEHDLQQLNATLERRIEERSRELMATEDQVRQLQKLEAIGQLTGGVAHDFNNLLTIIRSSAELLRRQVNLTEEKRRRYVDAISDTADRAARLTGQLLAFARRQALSPEVFDVVEKVTGVCEMLRTVVGARIDLVVHDRCPTCYVEVDASQFETALVNLAVNARDAMDGQGKLTITLEQPTRPPAAPDFKSSKHGAVLITVSDTGSGIAPHQLGKIFEPFFTTKAIGKGTGLGLSQVYGFVKQSGGEVEVDSRVGEGTSFMLYLPLIDVAPGMKTAAIAADDPDHPSGSVLIVEDNEQVGEFAAQLLADLGYQTRYAADAAQAMAVLEKHHDDIDVVFSDVVMPGESGVDLARRIASRWPGLAVVLTSGYSHVLAEDAQHGFNLLHKPYSVNELSRVLRKARARPS